MDKTCARCARPFIAKRQVARFCSVACRNAAAAARAKGQPESKALPKPKASRKPKPEATPTGTLGAVVAELTAAGRLDSSSGQAAIALARRIDDGAESSSGLASLTRELRAAMAEALARAEAAGDALDELRARREARRAG